MIFVAIFILFITLPLATNSWSLWASGRRKLDSNFHWLWLGYALVLILTVLR